MTERPPDDREGRRGGSPRRDRARKRLRQFERERGLETSPDGPPETSEEVEGGSAKDEERDKTGGRD